MSLRGRFRYEKKRAGYTREWPAAQLRDPAGAASGRSHLGRWVLNRTGRTPFPAPPVATGWTTQSVPFLAVPALSLFCGVNWFPESSGGQACWNISTNLDVRYLLSLRGKVIPCVQTGPGMYYEDSGDLAWGAKVGSGVLYRTGSHIQLEAGDDLQSIPDKELQFVTAHAVVELKY